MKSRKLPSSVSVIGVNHLQAAWVVLGAEGEVGEGLVREAGEQKGLHGVCPVAWRAWPLPDLLHPDNGGHHWAWKAAKLPGSVFSSVISLELDYLLSGYRAHCY